MFKAFSLNPGFPVHPERGSLGAGRLGRAQPVHDVLLAQDEVLPHGARVVAHVGLAGFDAWQCDGELVPELNEQTHPTTSLRVVARAKVRLTPGYSLRVHAVCSRSGMQQKLSGADWAYVGAGGSIQVGVAYSNGIDAASVSKTLTPKASKLDDGQEPEGAGEVWEELHELSGDLFPVDLGKDAEVGRRWSDNVTAAITIYYRGSPRVVDLVVFETPVVYVRETAEDDPRAYSTHLHTSGASHPLPIYPGPWPMTRRSDADDGDPSGGPRMALTVAARHGRVLGPTLFSWTAWRESTDVDATEAVAVASTSSSFVQLLAPAVTAWSEARAGWAAGAPGFARRADLAGLLELRDAAAVVPVRVRAWARVTDDTNPGTLRLQAGAHVLVDLPIVSEEWGWVERSAWLECGVNGDDPQTWQLLARVAGLGGAVEVRYLSVDYEAAPA